MLILDIEKLEMAMAREKLNRKDLADKSGISYATLNAYFQKRIQPSLKSLGLMSNSLNTDVENIVTSIPESMYGFHGKHSFKAGGSNGIS